MGISASYLKVGDIVFRPRKYHNPGIVTVLGINNGKRSITIKWKNGRTTTINQSYWLSNLDTFQNRYEIVSKELKLIVDGWEAGRKLIP